MNLEKFNQELAEFAVHLDRFHRLTAPNYYLGRPDHVAIKCADRTDYLRTCEVFFDETVDGIWEAEIDDRMLASAALKEQISIGGYKFGWLEIMQPRPGKETAAGYVEHTEFIVPDLLSVDEWLATTDIDGTEWQSNPGHAWINVPLPDTDERLEVKFTDTTLKQVTALERSQGKLHLFRRGQHGG